VPEKFVSAVQVFIFLSGLHVGYHIPTVQLYVMPKIGCIRHNALSNKHASFAQLKLKIIVVRLKFKLTIIKY